MPRRLVIKFRLDFSSVNNALVKYLFIIDLRELKIENRLISKSLTTENMSECIYTEPTENRGNTEIKNTECISFFKLTV